MGQEMTAVMQQDQPKDLLEYLLNSWDHPQADADYLWAFIEHARKVLAENQPVGLDYLGKTLALRLQDGTIVPIVDAENPATGGVAGSVDITQGKEKRGGKGSTAGSPSWGVTG